MDIYEKCPVLESDKLLIRLIEDRDADDLLHVIMYPIRWTRKAKGIALNVDYR